MKKMSAINNKYNAGIFYSMYVSEIMKFNTTIRKNKIKEEKRPIYKQKIFTQIISKMGNKIMEDIIYKGACIRIPDLGRFEVWKNKSNVFEKTDGTLEKKYLNINWPKTLEDLEKHPELKEEHYRRFNLNRHSDGFVFKIRWIKKGIKLAGLNIYSFKAHPNQRQKLKEEIFNNPGFDAPEKKIYTYIGEDRPSNEEQIKAMTQFNKTKKWTKLVN